jgi:hypothetical protein
MKELTDTLIKTVGPKKDGFDQGFQHVELNDKARPTDPSDPIRSAALFKDIEYYNRGKFSGETLAKYLELKASHEANGYLTRQQAIELNMMLSEF